MVELAYISYLMTRLRARLAATRLDERGEVTEKVIITAIFAALAIAAGAAIVAKVTARVESIQLQ